MKLRKRICDSDEDEVLVLMGSESNKLVVVSRICRKVPLFHVDLGEFLVV